MRIVIARELVRLARTVLEVKVKNRGFGILIDDDASKSMHSLIKYNDGYWKSEKQAHFLGKRIMRAGKDADAFTDVHQKLKREVGSGDIGVVYSEWKEGTKGFSNAWAFIVDEYGVRKRFSVWRKSFAKHERGNPALEQALDDLYDDFGYRKHLVPPELERQIRDRYEGMDRYQQYVVTKSGVKPNWVRR